MKPQDEIISNHSKSVLNNKEEEETKDAGNKEEAEGRTRVEEIGRRIKA